MNGDFVRKFLDAIIARGFKLGEIKAYGTSRVTVSIALDDPCSAITEGAPVTISYCDTMPELVSGNELPPADNENHRKEIGESGHGDPGKLIDD
jgi:hypothetical protein